MLKSTIRAMLIILFFSSLFAQTELPQNGLKHHFKFDDATDLSKAVIGNNLQAAALEGITAYHKSVAGYKAGDGAVEVGLGSFYKLDLDFEPNGPDTAKRVNQFSIVIDFMAPVADVWYGFHASDNDGDPVASDWDSFIRSNGKIGVGTTGYSFYEVETMQWYRLVISADLGNHYKYYLDGQLLQDGGERIADDRLSLPSIDDANQILLFGDNDGEDANIHISELGIYDRALTEEEIYNMGGWGHFITLESPTGNWLFDSQANLDSAATGKDIELMGQITSVAGPEDEPTNLAVTIPSGSYLKATHDILANGGGERVNQYTIVADIKIPALEQTYTLLQTDVSNSNDADLFINAEGKIGNSEIGYIDSVLTPGDWYRVVISADLENQIKVYLDGDSLFSSGPIGIDSKLSLSPKTADNKVLFFADDNGEDSQLDVAYLAIYNRVVSTEDIKGLGGFEHGPPNTELTGARTAVYFNGDEFNNKYARIAKTNEDFNFGEGDFTIELWTKPDISYPSDPSLISDKAWTSGSNPGWIISVRGDDWKFNMADENRDRFDVTGPKINDGNWHHIAVIAKRDSGVKLITDDLATIFSTDGEAFANVGNIDNPSLPICIAQDGTEAYPDGPPAPVQVDEVRIWKGVALEPEVIWKWRSKPLNEEHPNYANLVGYWRFNEGGGTTVKDLSGKNHDAELIGNPKWVISYAPFNGNLNDGYQHDVNSIWGGSTSGSSGGLTISADFPLTSQLAGSVAMSVNDAFEITGIAADKEDNPYTVFGNNGKTELTTNYVQAGIVARLEKIWSFDFTEVALSNVEIKFDISELGGTGNAGDVSAYKLLKANEANVFSEFSSAASVEGDVITFTVSGLTDGLYTLGSTDLTNSPIGNMIVGIDDSEELPLQYELSNNYPNPFNPSTKIKFAIPVEADVNISVFNILGQKVTEIINEELPAGNHQINWNSEENGKRLSSGMYIYRIKAVGKDGSLFNSSKKMLLLK